MAQADNISTTSRRRFLKGALSASVATPAAGAVPPIDHEIFSLQPAIADCLSQLNVALEALERAETAYLAWRKSNPPPRLRETWVGRGAEYEVWWRKRSEAKTDAER
jgi:hypothetical protein